MKKLTIRTRLLLLLTFLQFISLCNAGVIDKYKNDLRANRLALKDNAIWIAASKGLVKYDKALGKVSSASEELGIDSDIEYLAITSTSDNSLWFSSEEYGVVKYDGEVRNYSDSKYSAKISHRYIYSFVADSQGRVFCGDLDHIFYVDNLTPIDEYYYCKQLYYLTNGAAASFPGRPIIDMSFDSNDNLWILSNNKNASYKDGRQGLATLVKKEKDDLDELLKKEYVYPYRAFDAESLLEFDKINATSIVVDNEDNIWFTSDMGIHYYNQTTGKDSIINSTTHSAIPNEHFYANEKDSYGNIWFSSSKTLMKYDGEEFTTYTCPDYNEARSILCDGDIVWILLKNDTLLKFQNNEFEPIDLAPAVMGINESVIEAHKTKAYITNGELNIENEEGINSVVVYDAMGKVITSANANGATSTQIALPSNTKGLLIVKVNSEVIKVICN